jgi:hypothetical protein
MAVQPTGPVANTIKEQIKTTVEDRKKDVTIPAGKRAEQTVKNDAGTSLPDKP